MPITTILPPPPSMADPANFDSRADAFLPQLTPWQAEANALEVNVNAKEASATAAAAAASASASLTAFKGNWSALTGALAMPASVLHNGKFWALLAPLADVTAAVPGSSASWAAIKLSATIVREITTASATLAAGDHAVLEYSGAIAITLPTSPVTDDYIYIDPENGRTDNTIDPGAYPIGGISGVFTTSPAIGFGLKFISPAKGWRIA